MNRRLLLPAAFLLGLAPLTRAAEADPYLPDDARGVAHLNVRAALDAAFVKKYLREWVRTAVQGGGGALPRLLADFGLDPLRDVDRITLAWPGNLTTEHAVAVVRGRFDPAKVRAAAAARAKTHPDALKLL